MAVPTMLDTGDVMDETAHGGGLIAEDCTMVLLSCWGLTLHTFDGSLFMSFEVMETMLGLMGEAELMDETMKVEFVGCIGEVDLSKKQKNLIRDQWTRPKLRSM